MSAGCRDAMSWVGPGWWWAPRSFPQHRGLTVSLCCLPSHQVMALIGAHAIIVLLVLVLVFDVPVSKYITWAKSVSCLDMSWWDCSLASNNFALAQGTYSLAPEMAAAAGTAAPAFAGQPSSKYSSQPMRSARCCNELEFLYWTSPYRPGSPDVCGGSMVPVCYYSENFFQSKEHCQNVGSRHCTLEELQARETFSSGCGMDNKWVWTSTPCKARGQVGHYVARGGDGMRKECVANWELYDTRCCADAC